jgi:hypothetical protein
MPPIKAKTVPFLKHTPPRSSTTTHDPSRRSSHRPLLHLARLLACLLVITGLLATGIPAASAAPPKVGPFGPAIDPYSAYEPQSQCLAQEQPGVAGLRDLVMRNYPNTGRGWILRGCSVGGRSEHKEGRAWDWMVNAHDPVQKRQADELLTWLLATDEHGNRHALARRFGVMYIIWNRQVWKAYRPNDGWQPYSGASPHTDHVHFSFNWAGAKQRTTVWTASAMLAAMPGPYLDVPRNLAHHDAIAWMLHSGVAGPSSDGHFRPGSALTRAQMATWMWNLSGRPSGSPPHGFTDIPSGASYEQAVRWLVDSGISSGASAERFAPSATVTRQQMAAFLWRLAGRPASNRPHGFTDVPAARSTEVSWLREHGITAGVSADRFGGSTPTTRAQMASFLFRLTGKPAAWSGALPPTMRL